MEESERTETTHSANASDRHDVHELHYPMYMPLHVTKSARTWDAKGELQSASADADRCHRDDNNHHVDTRQTARNQFRQKLSKNALTAFPPCARRSMSPRRRQLNNNTRWKLGEQPKNQPELPMRTASCVPQRARRATSEPSLPQTLETKRYERKRSRVTDAKHL